MEDYNKAFHWWSGLSRCEQNKRAKTIGKTFYEITVEDIYRFYTPKKLE